MLWMTWREDAQTATLLSVVVSWLSVILIPFVKVAPSSSS